MVKKLKLICDNCIETGKFNTSFLGADEAKDGKCSNCGRIELIHNVIKEKLKIKKEEEINTKQLSSYIGDNFIAEQVYQNGINKFCFYNLTQNKVGYMDSFIDNKLGWERKIIPIEGEEIEKGAILLPTKAEEYESDEKLDEEIRTFIRKWLDIPEDTIQFALWNIKRSWVYERFHTLNYLRALGDTGMGKSRFLDTLGYIHYKPIATSGATTAAPVFRIIDKWKGTLIIDEADLKKSDESQDIVKIINQGYEKGKYIMRCDTEDNNKIKFFDPYCPKILGTRKVFEDKATESRCITQVMTGTMRDDIPWNINKKFWEETESIRNKLLMWRFKNYLKIDPEKEIDFDLGELEPRVKQIVNSFINLFSDDKEQLEKFRIFIVKHQDNLIDERRNSWAGSVVGAIHELIKAEKTNISSQDIIEMGSLTSFKGEPLKPRGLASTLKSLGFEKTIVKKVEGFSKRIIPLNEKHLIKLFKRYGYEVTKVTIHTDKRSTTKEDQNGLGNDLVGKEWKF